jgi:DNA-binding NtrC family response regulator
MDRLLTASFSKHGHRGTNMTFVVSHCEHGPPGGQLPHGRFSKAEIEIIGSLVGRTIAEVERELICATLVHCHGNRTRSASVLDISIRALRNKIHAYKGSGVAVPEPSQTD